MVSRSGLSASIFELPPRFAQPVRNPPDRFVSAAKRPARLPRARRPTRSRPCRASSRSPDRCRRAAGPRKLHRQITLKMDEEQQQQAPMAMCTPRVTPDMLGEWEGKIVRMCGKVRTKARPPPPARSPAAPHRRHAWPFPPTGAPALSVHSRSSLLAARLTPLGAAPLSTRVGCSSPPTERRSASWTRRWTAACRMSRCASLSRAPTLPASFPFVRKLGGHARSQANRGRA